MLGEFSMQLGNVARVVHRTADQHLGERPDVSRQLAFGTGQRVGIEGRRALWQRVAGLSSRSGGAGRAGSFKPADRLQEFVALGLVANVGRQGAGPSAVRAPCASACPARTDLRHQAQQLLALFRPGSS